MNQIRSRSAEHWLKRSLLTLLLISTACPIPGASATDSVQLKPLMPQTDTTAKSAVPSSDPESSQPADTDRFSHTDGFAQTNKIHKLEINKQSLGDGVDDSDSNNPGTALVPVETETRPSAQIYMHTYSIKINGATTIIGDPLVMMRAMFGVGASNSEMRKLYAERDTGYGVCGFRMNMPLTGRGYAEILNCFPSMPAAEANIHPGDLITAVDGQSTLDLPPKEVWNYFTGMPGTEVNLELLRGKRPFNVTLKRMDIGRIPDFGTRAEFLNLFVRNGISKFVQR